MRQAWFTAGLLTLVAGCSCNANHSPGDPGTDTPETPGAIDPGRVTLHRLNRAEYNNTVRDLLGTSRTPADDFPYDDTSFGFDNIADTLTVSPLLVELAEKASADLATEAVTRPLAEPYDVVIEAESSSVSATTGGLGPDHYNLWSNGDLYAPVDLPVEGRYALSARLYAQQAGAESALASLGVDGVPYATFEVHATSRDTAEIHTIEVPLGAGRHTVVVSFLNDVYDPAAGQDRNLLIDWVAAYGPTDAAPGDNPIRDRLFVCEPSSDTDRACAGEILAPFARRAWRRPVTPGEVDDLLSVFDRVTTDGGTFDDGIRLGLQYLLLSHHFLYRVEIDPDPGSLTPAPLTDHELASRLSYFLWSSMPDDALFAAADDGRLQDPEEIARQVHRMLADPKAEALTQNFAGQWLYIRGIDNAFPDAWTYPEFDEDLRASMKEEMSRFFRTFIEQDRDMAELLLATEGEIDARLAAHYDLSGVEGWETVDLTRADRGGLLGQSGLHLVTSYPMRTSPVRRGKWVLGNLLCSEPPPPPPGVEGLVEASEDAATVRERLEQHREDPSCAACHDVMDNLGFPFEHFDGVGAWRMSDAGHPVDASGVLPDGRAFYGTRELAGIVAADPLYTECVAEKVFTYALGRAPTGADTATLHAIDDHFVANGRRFSELAVAIATSPAFRLRRGEP